ncbi:glycosyltransferase family 2 protein [Pedobacter sp. MR2016-24]|uniref:glycosyltransferase family 2 protein n=1 Tax=Pedobacter sp. MR2016-24 TaxID=2994466 RepID=UPI0022468ECF|nr:glycosyltransferase family 2 protein [Pedobacter sp. MR2016-24]MCX2482120.1 glycosyltransferase family 2 protein [Pedobacter sp. MR2016-24]
MNAKKISIITVSYNNFAGLQKTIESVIKQEFSDYEFIIIDGNSTDGSKELLEKYEDKLTYWVSEPDNGIYHAMNKGISVSRGQYILFLNSGDSLHDNQVLSTVTHKINGNYGIYYGDIIYEEADKKNKRSFPKQLTFQFFVEHNISHQASFIKRSLFEEIFFYNEGFKIVSDWEFFIYAICKENVPHKHLDFIVTDYDATGISSNVENHAQMHKERNISLKKYFPAFVADYQQISQIKEKRVQQFFIIKENRVLWKILKAFMTMLVLFLPAGRKK